MRAVFLDRDGVICQNRPDYVKSWSEFTFIPGAREALAQLAELGMPVVVATNQSVINRGIASAEVIEEINRRMIMAVQAVGGRIDCVLYCPHRPDEGCSCRKPQPGMLRQAATELGINLAGSYLVGDGWTDIQAGLTVGCTPFLVLTGRGVAQMQQAMQLGADRLQIVRDLPQAVESILQVEWPCARKLAT